MERLIVDTDVIIDATRGNPSALDFLEKYCLGLVISSVTIAELHAGFRNKKEETRVSEMYRLFEVRPVDEKITMLAGDFRKQYGKSHGSGIVDCIIAATAESIGATLVTLNKKHFPMLKDVLVPYKK